MLKIWEVTCDNGEKYLVTGERKDIIGHALSADYLCDLSNPMVTDIRYVRTIWDRVWGKV